MANLREVIATPTALVVRISTGPRSHLPRKCEMSNWSVDSGFSQPEQPGGDYYPDEEMDYEESPSTTPAPAPAPTRQREREKESRHDDPKRRHGHRS